MPSDAPQNERSGDLAEVDCLPSSAWILVLSLVPLFVKLWKLAYDDSATNGILNALL